MATLRYMWNQYASPLMLLLLLAAVVVGVAVGVGLARVRVRRGKAPLSRGTYLVGVLLWLWLVGMICVTLLGSRGIWGSGEVNLQLFLAWEEAWYAGDRTAWLYIVLNLALFLPLGVLLPLLEKTLSAAAWVSKAVTLCAVYLCIAMFVRPMLDAHSPQYTVLWAKKRSFRLPLIALSVIRVLLIVFIVFLPIRTVLGIHSLWILPLLAAPVLVAGHFGWFASAYLLVETRFLTNFNERLLQQYGDSNDATWLDEKMYVTELICPPEEAGKDLRALGWGRRYGANIIKIVRGKKEFDIPSGDMVLNEGDRLAVIGEKENLVSLRLSIGADAAEDIPTLHTYIAGEKALYTYTLDVAKNDHLAGSTIRDSGLRENYDCMILGLQRNLLPIIGPDVNFVIQRGDLVWLLGSHRMAEKALDDMEEA